MFLIGLLGVVVSTNQPAALSNFVEQTTGVAVKVPEEDPVEKEFTKLEDDDDAAHEEVDLWIKEHTQFKRNGASVSDAELNDRIRKRLAPIQKAYENFIERHPKHVKVRLAYASFLEGIGDEEGELKHLEVARELDPKDPAVWNNLGNYYGHNGTVTNAFAYYEKAITLDPNEPVYYHNFGTTVYLFRKDAREFYNINEQQVFDKAMNLYSNSIRLDPTNFVLASDVAQSYYGIKPLRTNDALQAWTNTLKIAKTEIEREGVYLHLARLKMAAGRYKEAHEHINAVTNATYDELKERLAKNLAERESGTNSPSTTATETNSLANSVTVPASTNSTPTAAKAKQ
jgi:tetratricopeptide (TPR) repeat protein